jgi:peroxiredoxin
MIRKIMAASSTDSMAPGTPAPEFNLPDVVSGRLRSLEELAGPSGTLVIFLCAHCPYVVHVRKKLAELAERYFPLGVTTLGISSNDAIAYPEDAPEKLRKMVQESALPFPVLYDESQQVAAAYTAACTPDFFLFDATRRLAYRGRLDASSPRNGQPLTGDDLEKALTAVVEGSSVPTPWPPALGCSIKWRI